MRYVPNLETLESRVTPYTISPYRWAKPIISYSFQASLLTELSNTAGWQLQFIKAVNRWQLNANIKIMPATGTGDISIGARPMPSIYVGAAYYPYPNTPIGGD